MAGCLLSRVARHGCFVVGLALCGGLGACRSLADFAPAASSETRPEVDASLGDQGTSADVLRDTAASDVDLGDGAVPPHDLPEALLWGKMTYAPFDGSLYLYGGLDINGEARNHLWRFDGTRWHVVCASCSAPNRIGHAFVATNDRLLLYGGVDAIGADPADPAFHVYDPQSRTWSAPQTGVQPPPRSRTLSCYDEARDVLVVFGGMTSSGGAPNDTLWELNVATNTWRPVTKSGSWPSARQDWGSAMTYVPRDGPSELAGRVVLYGGGSSDIDTEDGLDDAWAWDGTTWSPLCSDCTGDLRQAAGVAYDRQRGMLVVVGGFESGPSGALGELAGWWSYVGGATMTRESMVDPGPRDGMAIAYFSGGGLDTIVVAGGNGVSCPEQPGGSGPFVRNCAAVWMPPTSR